MVSEFISLTVIALVAATAPVVARVIPRQVVPETVLLIVAGAILGPNMLGIITSSADSITLLSDLGCAFLFLLAGYEIDPASISGQDGRHGLVTWAITFGVAIVFAVLMPDIATGPHALAAVSLLLTTTALGTLMPILKERGLMGTRVGDLVISYGTWGELGPVLAMAVLLSTRARWQTAVILLLFAVICVVMALLGKRAKKGGGALYRFLESKANTTSQTMMRLTVLMLVALVAFSAIFDLDIVLGAFAAGFVMRFLSPEGAPELEAKLDGMAYGFFIPLFFIVSGCKIDLAAVTQAPLLLVFFILALILVRCVPIALSLSLRKQTRREVTMHNRLAVAFYCTTALPLIVAITSVAVGNGIMETSTASVLVAAGALTVFLMPLLGAVAYRVADAEPIQAIREIAREPGDTRDIVREHLRLGAERARDYREFATMRVRESIEAIEDDDERAEVRELVRRHAAERKTLVESHRDEVVELYKKHHDGELSGLSEHVEMVERIMEDEAEK